MKRLLLKTYYIWILLFTVSCNGEKKQQSTNTDTTIKVDSSVIKYFLQDPRDYSLLHKLQHDTECNLSKIHKPVPLLETALKKEYHDCIYLYKGEKIAAMRSSVYKTDSTWAFGTNGFEIYFFETNKPSFPLKYDLKIGSSIHDFQKIFGNSEKLKDTYSYNFKFNSFSSKLVLESQENSVTKMTITNENRD